MWLISRDSQAFQRRSGGSAFPDGGSETAPQKAATLDTSKEQMGDQPRSHV